jgi:hypothetical protein
MILIDIQDSIATFLEKLVSVQIISSPKENVSLFSQIQCVKEVLGRVE